MVNVHVPPEQMTFRARAYLQIVALRWVLIGLAIFIDPGGFDASSYSQIKSLTFGSIRPWGYLLIATGLGLQWAALVARERSARWALIGSVAMGACWTGGFIAAWRIGELTGPTGPILFTSIVALDLVAAAQPIRAPMEPVIRRLLGEPSRSDPAPVGSDGRS